MPAWTVTQAAVQRFLAVKSAKHARRWVSLLIKFQLLVGANQRFRLISMLQLDLLLFQGGVAQSAWLDNNHFPMLS